jgi:hypothetical protein
VLPLTDPLWPDLDHAYGPAADIPDLLQRARQDQSPGHLPRSPWYELWSALCHQGDVYLASYAAVPHLADIAHDRRDARAQFEPLFLIGSIELARLEGRGPPLRDALGVWYAAALQKTQALIDEALFLPWSAEQRDALEAARLAVVGNPVKARALLDAGR